MPRSLLRGYLMRTVIYGVGYPVSCGGDLLLNPDAVSVAQSNRTLIEYCEKDPRAGIVWGRLVDHSDMPLPAMEIRRRCSELWWICRSAGRLSVGSRGIFRRLLGRCSMKFHHASRSGACHGCQGPSCVAGEQSGMKLAALMNRFLNYEDVDLCLSATPYGWEVCMS